MVRYSKRYVMIELILCLCLRIIPGNVHAAPISDPPGKMHFYLHQTSAFDVYTSDTSNTAFWSWMNQYVWRAMEYSPYFDAKLALFRNAFVYDDAYAIYNNGSGWAVTHPEWILRTKPGASAPKVYINYGCSGGTCPQYAADVSNPNFKSAWIENARLLVGKGYKGLMVDDVNLAFEFSDGKSSVTPYDTNTHQLMTETGWENYMAQFMVQIRSAFPGIEIVHNSIWFAGGSDITSRASNPYVALEQSAADYINIERGATDSGLTGGTGFFSYRELLNFIDRAQQRGAG